MMRDEAIQILHSIASVPVSIVGSGEGHPFVDTHGVGALPVPLTAQAIYALEPTVHLPEPDTSSGNNGGHPTLDDHRKLADDDLPLDVLHSLIAHFARQYHDIQEARKAFNNRVGAMKRDGLPDEFLGTSEELFRSLETLERQLNRELTRLVKKHPMASWVDQTEGLGYLGFGLIIGVTGSLSNFSSPSKVWKYMGMHVTEKGTAPKREKGVGFFRTDGDKKGTAYSPLGRTVCFNIGKAIVRLNRGEYREAYDTKYQKYISRERVGESGCPFLNSPVHKDRNGKVLACVKQSADGESSAHIDNAARRFAVKLMLKHMWQEWRS